MTTFDRIVIGAGISGLLVAMRAANEGDSVLVLEREAKPGGVIQPITLDGGGETKVTVDGGAEAFSIAGEAVLQLIAELGMSDRIVSPTRADARIISSSDSKYQIPHGVFGIPSSLDNPELNQIISPAALKSARSSDHAAVGNWQVQTVAQLVEERLGAEFVDKLVDPVVAGVHGSSSRILNASRAMPALVAAYAETGSLVEAAAKIRASQPRPGAAVASLSGGMYNLIDRIVSLLQGLKVQFVFNADITSLERVSEGWRCQTESKGFTATKLTLACSADSAFGLLSELVKAEPNFSATPAESLAETAKTDTDSVIAIALVRSKKLNEKPLGSGALVAQTSGFAPRATTHVNAKWLWLQEQLGDDMHVVRFSYGDTLDEVATDVQARVASDLFDLYQVNDAEVLDARLLRWSQALHQPSLEANALVNRLIEIGVRNDIELCGSFISGNGLLAITKDHYERSAK